jgi:YidC/Oxa1 family membrane protein insertase
VIGSVFNAILIAPLVNALFLIYGIIPGHDFGIAIILFTVAIRLILWPLTKKQLHSQKKMQSLQGDIAKIKAKAGGDKQKESAMLMELYKEKEVNPFSACLPALLQFPILIAIFIVFRRSTGDINQIANILYNPIEKLPHIQQVLSGQLPFNSTLLGILPMTKSSAILAILAGLTQLIQVKMITPRKQKTNSQDPQAQMTAMMNYTFPTLTVFIAWSLPAALPLYWIITNIVSIFQQWLVMRKEVDVMEEVDVVQVVSKTKNKSSKNMPKPKVITKLKKGGN